jgi:hypothetical protein
MRGPSLQADREWVPERKTPVEGTLSFVIE